MRISLLLYQLFLGAYAAGIRMVTLWNGKAKKWVIGRRNLFEELTQIFNNNHQSIVWMHCASLGEFEQGRPLLEALKEKNEKVKILVTFFSPSGFDACKNYKGADYVFYLPMDGKKNAVRFLNIVKPDLVLWVKYEYWFYYLQELKKRKITVLLVSGVFRDNQPFFKWYGQLWKKMLDCFSFLFVQNEKSKHLLSTIQLKDNVEVTGDTRFDRVISLAEKFEPLPLIEKFCAQNKVLVAGSTWEEDETELIHYVKTNPQIKFIIVPHEVDEENISGVQKSFSNSVRYTQFAMNPWAYNEANCLIIDNMGMLSRLYYYADITYVGGGFGTDGVHNVLEAAVYGKPVLFGPVYEKYREAIELIECSGAQAIEDALSLEAVLNILFNNEVENDKMCKASREYVKTNGGATKKIIDFIYENRLLTN